MLQRIETKTMFAVLLVLLTVAALGQLGVAKAYWDEWYWGGQVWGAYGQSWYYQLKQAGYSQGYNDGRNGNQYDCSVHTMLYCASYGKGYADGQAQYSNNQGSEQQSSSSTSYSQSNPYVKVVINNIIPNSNNSTVGAAQNSGTGENN